MLRLLIFLPMLSTTFGQNAIDLKMNEELPVSTVIANLTGEVIKFLGPPSNFLLTLLPSQNFKLRQGQLEVNRTIDREAICPTTVPCTLNERLIVTYPSTTNQLLVSVEITVEDINDNSPYFVENSTQITISEGAKINATRVLPRALDKDIGENSIKRYFLVTDEPDPTFGVEFNSDDPNSAMLIVRKELDRERQDSYFFILIAQDNGNPQKESSINVTVTISDANDHKPTFQRSLYEAKISENVPSGGLVTQVLATDRDSGANADVRYRFVRSAPESAPQDSDKFSVDEKTGEIRTAVVFDREQQSVYELRIEARDQGPDSSPVYCRVRVEILDENDNAPNIQFTPILPGSGVVEHSKPPIQLAVVIVDDFDEGTNAKVDCEVGDKVKFSLDKQGNDNYLLTLRVEVDREKQGTLLSTTIRCWDNGDIPETTLKQFNLTILDLNDNAPVFSQTVYKTKVLENNKPNLQIYQVYASDSDLEKNGAINFELRAAYRDRLKINPVSGIISAIVSLDRERQEVLNVEVYAVDGGTPPLTGTATVEITLLDINDINPSFTTNPLMLHIAENVQPMAEVGRITAVDTDKGINSEVRYELVTQFGDWAEFELDADTGVLSTKASFDREQTLVRRLKVIARDQGSPALSSTVNVHVNIDDVNDNDPELLPIGCAAGFVNITFHAAPGSIVCRLHARDPDHGINAITTFQFRPGSNEHGIFVLNNRTGILSVARPMSADMVGMHSLAISISDQGSPMRTINGELYIAVDVYSNESAILDRLSESREQPRKNFTIVIAVACVSGALAVLLIIAIVILLRRQNCRKAPAQTDTRQLFSGSAASSKSSHDRSITFNSHIGDMNGKAVRKKEVSFSSDVERHSVNRGYPEVKYHHHPFKDTELSASSSSSLFLTTSPQRNQLQHEHPKNSEENSVRSDSDSGRGGSEEEVHAVHGTTFSSNNLDVGINGVTMSQSACV